LGEIEQLSEAKAETLESDRLEFRSILLEGSERSPIPSRRLIRSRPSSNCMEARGLTRKDLEPFTGSRARISEVLARRRPLTLSMI